MRKFRPFLLSFALMMAAKTDVEATTICIPKDVATIQLAIDGASDGDTVLVADGVYTGPGNRDIDFKGKAIVVISENGPESTIIDCQGEGRGFIFQSGEDSRSVVSGFTIRNGSADCGGGIYCGWNSSPMIIGNIITGNSALFGGGIYCEWYSSPTIAGNIIAGNSASFGGGIYCKENSSPVVHNTIIWANRAKNELCKSIYVSNNATITVTYSDVEGGWAGEGNIRADPLFVDPENEDYRLRPGSPCKDAGDPSSPLDPDGTRADIGVYFPSFRLISVAVPDTFAFSDSTVTIPIIVSEATGIAGAEITVAYNPNVLIANEAKTTALTSDFTLADSISNGKIAISLARATGIADGSGSLVDLTFQVVGSPGDTAWIVLKQVTLYDDSGEEIACARTDGLFTVKGGLGDINFDGLVDTRDVILCLRIIVGLPLPTEPGGHVPTAYENWAADMNRDGNVNSADALLILYKCLDRLIAAPKLITSDDLKAVVRLPEVAALPGEVVTVPILVEGRPDISGADIRLAYDPDALTVIDVKACASGSLIEVNTRNPGQIITALINPDGIVGPGCGIIRVRFRVKGDISKGLSLERIALFDSNAEPVEVCFLGSLSTSVAEDHILFHPRTYALFQNHPNPFNARTMISYQLAQEGKVTLRVYNLAGQLVRTLLDEKVQAGQHSVIWDGRDDSGQEVSSGVYFYRLIVEGGVWTEARRMVLTR